MIYDIYRSTQQDEPSYNREVKFLPEAEEEKRQGQWRTSQQNGQNVRLEVANVEGTRKGA